MYKFRVRLTLLLVAIVGLSMLAAGIFTASLLKESEYDGLRQNMLNEIKVIMATVEWPNEPDREKATAYFTGKAEMLKKEAAARVTFIRQDGTVLGDSEKRPEEMDNHLGRQEIQAALSASVGYATRYSDTLMENMLYVAMPVYDGDKLIGFIRLSKSLSSIEATMRAMWYYLIGGLFVLFLIAGLAGYRFASQVTKPLEKITRIAKQITDKNYKSRILTPGRDEIGELGRAINAMADGLQLQMERIHEDESRLTSVLDNMTSGVIMVDREGVVVLLNRSAEEILGYDAHQLLGKRYERSNHHPQLSEMIERCIGDKDTLRGEMNVYYPQERTLDVHLVPLVHAEEEWAGIVIVMHDISAIRRLERMRSEFVANVSHELKTPIAAVKGFAETLLAGAMNDPDTAKSFLHIIYDESERLNRLIGDILELSKIESKRTALIMSPVQFHALVVKTLDMLRAEADKKQIRLQMEVPQELFLEADEDRLQQIIMNLLQNGINYTPEGGMVAIKAKLTGNDEEEKVQIVISDTGIGIPKKDLPRIFERFYRVDKARSRMSGGTGLGLSIVKHLVELHHGTIRVDSNLGVGTTFTLELPVIHTFSL